MSAPPAVRLEGAVDARERPLLVAAAQQLSEALISASGGDWPIELRFRKPDADLAAGAEGAVVLLSLLADVDRDEPFAETEARWRARVEALSAAGATVVLLTVFRHLPERSAAVGGRRLQRIRRLNRLAIDLSHDFVATVADIDRAFAHIGARVLGTDFALGGPLAAEVGGHTVTLSLFFSALDAWVPIEIQERARAFHRPLREIDLVVSRRLARA